ncbi:MAG: hypothetical protein FWG06_03605 [Clostridiales bacterium]|nr:hypothetical protein [Clostridiales bacterium]
MAEQSKNIKRQSPARKREMLSRGLIAGAMLLASAVLFVLLFSLTLPWAAEAALSRGFRQGLNAKTVLADVKARSAWHLLMGKSESTELMMEFGDSGLLALSLLRAKWGPGNDALGMIRRGKSGERYNGPEYAELYWDEGKLAAYLNRVQGEALISRVKISKEQLELYGSIALNGGRHNIYLAALPQSDDLGRVAFTALEWRAEGLVYSERLKERICETLSFEIDLSPLDWNIPACRVELSPGQMLVCGGLAIIE